MTHVQILNFLSPIGDKGDKETNRRSPNFAAMAWLFFSGALALPPPTMVEASVVNGSILPIAGTDRGQTGLFYGGRLGGRCAVAP